MAAQSSNTGQELPSAYVENRKHDAKWWRRNHHLDVEDFLLESAGGTDDLAARPFWRPHVAALALRGWVIKDEEDIDTKFRLMCQEPTPGSERQALKVLFQRLCDELKSGRIAILADGFQPNAVVEWSRQPPFRAQFSWDPEDAFPPRRLLDALQSPILNYSELKKGI